MVTAKCYTHTRFTPVLHNFTNILFSFLARAVIRATCYGIMLMCTRLNIKHGAVHRFCGHVLEFARPGHKDLEGRLKIFMDCL